MGCVAVEAAEDGGMTWHSQGAADLLQPPPGTRTWQDHAI